MDLSSYPNNLQITPRNAAGTASNLVTIEQGGVVRSGQDSGTVFLDVRRQPEQTVLRSAKMGCQQGDSPWIQVSPIYIYLRFNDAMNYLTGQLPRGLGLTPTEANQVIARAVQRVQDLYDGVMANVVVTSMAPPSWTMDQFSRDYDGVVTVEIHFETDSQGMPLPVREWAQPPKVIYGEAPVNELNWLTPLPGSFGLDALRANSHGVFLNRLPFLKPQTSPPTPLLGRRASIQQIGDAVGNVAAHESGHALGLVPNNQSNQLRNERLDTRFGGVDFDGNSKNHSSTTNQNHIMVESLTESTASPPTVLTTVPEFRPQPRKDGAYLRAILPK
jgi:hypothetical protein